MSGTTTAKPDAPITRLELIRADTIEPEPVDWLWQDRIAFGSSTIIAGHPGLGKSTVTVQIASAVTRGTPMPGSSTPTPRRDVLMVSAEDHFSRSIVPRLMAAEADRSRVHFMDLVCVEYPDGHTKEREFDLTLDIAPLRSTLVTHPQIGAVFIDPMSAYLGTTDTHKQSDVRGALRPLERLAQELGVAAVCVLHLNKGSGTDAMMRVSGSLAFVAAARAAHLVVADAEDETRRLFLPLKSNLGPRPDGLAFRVEPTSVAAKTGRLIATSRIVWADEPVTITANDAMAAQGMNDAEERSAREEAVEWLVTVLASGARPRRELVRQAKAEGLPWRTVHRGAKVLGVNMDRDGFAGGSTWSLPAPFVPTDPHSCHDSVVARMDGFGTNGEPNTTVNGSAVADLRDVWEGESGEKVGDE